MDQIADRLDQVADVLRAVDRQIPALSIAPGAFGADDAGTPGRLGRELHAHWAAVLDARSQEAAGAASRLSEVAQSVRITRRQYAETDETVQRRLKREM
ncbi:type VII secretion target [Micromonosporaceae bacterium Da 78-11]